MTRTTPNANSSHTMATPKVSKGSRQRSQSRAIAIIGMSGRFPGGANSPETLWETLRSGTDAVGEVQGDRWDLGWHHPDPGRDERVYTKAGGFLDRIDGFDAEFFGISPREARQVDPQHRLLLELAWEAIEDAGIAPRRHAGTDTGVFIGISGNDYAYLVGPQAPDAYSNTGSALSIAANRISYIFDFHGPSVSLDTACSSSLVCIHQACASLLAGDCSTALAGGVNLLINVRPWIGFSKASMLSPTGRCRSFDAGGDGYVRSEGGALMMLKTLADAERDGDRILGVILASGVNSDGRTLGLSMPNGDAQERLLRKVYADSGVTAEDVFYVEAHGTGTSVGDPIECESLGRVLGQPRTDGSRCLIGSVKSNIGHLEAASGVAGLTKVLLALRHREIPGNLHFVDPNPKIDFENWKLDVVTANTPLPVTTKPLVIGVNSFGFGGTNAHLVIQEYRAPRTRIRKASRKTKDAHHILILSGHSQEALRAVAQTYVDFLRSTSDIPWSDICAAAATCRSMQRHRLALAASSASEAADKLAAFLSGEQVPRLATAATHASATAVAFVYSGNGPQWWGMGRELLAGNQVFRDEIKAIDAIFAPLAGWSLLAEMQRPESESRVALTEYAQPLLFALQVGLTRLLRDVGIHPSAVLGHSVGEVAAAYASSALTLEQATHVIFYRSKSQASTAGHGRMAALGVGPAAARDIMAGIDGWLEIAAINAPESVTVAGDPIALGKMIESLTEAGKFARLLPLNYPFHTRAMEPIREELLDSLKDLAPSATEIPFISTVDGTPLPGQQLDAAYWYRNVREPVQFSQAIHHLLSRGEVAVFLEIGPHPVLKDYIQQSARSAASSAVAVQTLRRPSAKGPEPEIENLWTAICAAHAYGVTHLDQLFTRPTPPPALPLYPWQRIQHWRGSVILPDILMPIEREHPLLGHRVPSADGLWENTLDTNQLKYLSDHVVQGSVLFPAAGHIELAFAGALRLLGEGTLDIDNLDILRPLTIPAHGDPLIQFAADAKDGTFEIRSRSDVYSTEWSRQVRGRISRLDSPATIESFDLEELRQSLPYVITAEEHYASTAERGLVYGPYFQGVIDMRIASPNGPILEALAEIHLPYLDQVLPNGYRAHPVLLDSCLQVVVTLIGRNEKRGRSVLPVFFGRTRSFAPLPSRVFCHVVLRKESSRSAVADFRVTDPDGNVLLELHEARCQKVDFTQATASPLIAEWWRPDPAAAVLAPLSPLPTPSQTLTALEPAIQRASEDHRRADFYRTIRPQMDRLIGAYASRVIAALDPGTTFDLPTIASIGSVHPSKLGLLESLLDFAAQDGSLSVVGTTWQRNPSTVPPAPEPLWKEMFLRHPRYQSELLLLAQAGDALLATLRSEAPRSSSNDASSALLEQLHDTSPFQAPYNQIARSAIESLLARWPANRPLRILEVGGEGGSFASWILPVLPISRTDYVFSDVSEAILARAKHRLASHRFVRFATLDLERDLVEQDQPADYFDLVIGTIPAATAHSTLTRLQRVMAPDAQLLLLAPQPDRLAQLILADDSGSSSPVLLAAAEWSRTLATARLEDIVQLSDSSACPSGESPQQTIFLARRNPAATHAQAPAGIPAEAIAPRRWLVVVEEHDGAETAFNEQVKAHLQAAGHTVEVTSFAPDARLENAVLKAWKQHPADSVVYLAAASSAQLEGQQLLESQMHRSLTALHLVRTLEATRQQTPVQLTLVTRGAFSNAFRNGPLDPAQSTLWGLGRVIANELPGLNSRLIDLHAAPQESDPAALWLATELLRRDDESEVQLVAGHRFVNRERLMTLTDEARNAPVKPSDQGQPFTLDFRPQGGLDSLYLRPSTRIAPSSHQVEIEVKAAGLNFRDVLWAMGMLPDEAVENGFSGPTIGMECSGEIVRVGSAVTNVKPGDRVVAFASSCFASHVTTDANSVALIPPAIDYTEAATIPTAFLTAWYALVHLAHLAPGESVLIHGAAGGVGIAAIQIAKLKGATVFGTAGSVRKRRMLEMLGVDHVLNSRSLDFADQVMNLTDGIGVDVVLNSLAGEAITKSLQCLRPFGRFLEIGKRDLYANSRIGLRPFRNNLSYFGIDADTLLIERADLAHTVFQEVMDHFATGDLRPLPFQSVPIARASEAFRAMQQSRHIGKLVVSMQIDDPSSTSIVHSRSAVKSDGTYLVTGGLGGFGLATAKWLVEQGATSLALLGRRGPVTEEAIAGIAELERAGATVRGFATDIADAASLNETLELIRASMSPLIGVIHSAAVIEDAPILQIGSAQLTRVLTPKVLGAWNLHKATLHDPISMFVLYSSSSSVVGNPGQGAYVAGNLYLDSLAEYRRSLGLPGLAIGWGAIKDAGFLTRHTAVADMLRTRTGLDATPSHEALEDLGRLAAVDATRVCVARFDLQRLGQMLPGVLVPRFFPIITQGAVAALHAEETLADRLSSTPESERRPMVLACIREHAARVLGTGAAQIDVDQPLSDLGLDSLMAVELAVAVERDLAQPVSVMQLLSAGTIQAIAEMAFKMLGATLTAEPDSQTTIQPAQEPQVLQEIGA